MNAVFTSSTAESLAKEYQDTVSRMQSDLKDKIMSLQTKGDFPGIQKLTAESQKMILDLGQAYQEALSKINGGTRPVFDSSLCTMDLDLAVYDGDRDYIEEFSNDPDIQTAVNELKQNNPVVKSRKRLLKTALRVTPVLAPALYNIGKKCSDRIGLKKQIEFYIYQSEEFNAACYPPDDDRYYIIISSGLVQKFDEAELSFVIGHEIGHALFGHSRFSPRAILDQGADYLSPLHAMKLYAWSRCAEISADRIGLLCCGDFEAAGRCFFKLSSGITTSSIDFKLREYIKQFVDLQDIIKDSEVDPEDWYSTHPFGPLRIKALELFEKSRTYHTLSDVPGGKISEEKLETQIRNILTLMEPSYLDSSDENGRKIQKFIFLAGYLIMISDGEVKPEEIQSLSRIIDPEIFAESMKAVDGLEEDGVIEKLKELGDDINALFSTIQKLNVLKDLCIISNADGQIDDSEIKNLYGLAGLLGIKESFIDKTINDMNEQE
jgi:uncharacterized tellurite resistance protein B-like protein